MFTTADRDAVLDRAVQLLSDDDRVEALVLTGSLGRGTEDRWSDIDLDAVITAGAEAATVAAEWQELAYREWPVAHHYATEFGSTLVRGYLLRDALLLDMAFTPIDDFSAWAPVRVLFDRAGRVTATASDVQAWSPTPDAGVEAGFAGHDVLHACVAANRGRRWQSLYFVQRVRNRTLALASERHGWDSDDFTRVDDLPADQVGELEGSLVATLDRDELLGAVDIATRAFLTELGRHDRARLYAHPMPRSYIFGERSLPDPDTEQLTSHGVQVLVVPDAGHDMPLDNPGGLAEVVADALGLAS